MEDEIINRRIRRKRGRRKRWRGDGGRGRVDRMWYNR